jgi:hypothetical protein
VSVLPVSVAPEGAVTSAKATFEPGEVSIWYVYVAPWLAAVPGVLVKAGVRLAAVEFAPFVPPPLHAARKTEITKMAAKIVNRSPAVLLARIAIDVLSAGVVGDYTLATMVEGTDKSMTAQSRSGSSDGVYCGTSCADGATPFNGAN